MKWVAVTVIECSQTEVGVCRNTSQHADVCAPSDDGAMHVQHAEWVGGTRTPPAPVNGEDMYTRAGAKWIGPNAGAKEAQPGTGKFCSISLLG